MSSSGENTPRSEEQEPISGSGSDSEEEFYGEDVGVSAPEVVDDHEIDYLDESSDDETPIPRPQLANKKTLLALRFDDKVSPDVWLKKRKLLLMLLEARMLLREMVEYKLNAARKLTGNLSIAEIMNLLAKQGDDGDDSDFIADIQELKKQLIKEIRKNYGLERELQKVENKISLLIANRTSIQEIDREVGKKKGKKSEDADQSEHVDILKNRKLLDLYSNMFYLLQSHPAYLAKLLFLIPAEQMDKFMVSILLTLFGDAFSPREEYLLLSVFKLAIGHDINLIRSGPLEFTQSDSIVPKMVITYNKRKQGVEYLKNTLSRLMADMMEQSSNFELKPVMVYKALGGKEALSSEEAAARPDVAKEMEKRSKELESTCQKFLDAIVDSLTSLPYGLRLICKQIRTLVLAKFPKAPAEEIWKVMGYYVYYRFINLAIVTPEAFGIGGGEPSVDVLKNLIVISKVLQKLFNLSLFKKKDEHASMNPWLEKSQAVIVDYFKDLIEVPEPEDYLQVDRYNEMMIRTKPLIIIGVQEIVQTHTFLKRYQNGLFEKPDDPLKTILQELGDVPSVNPSDDRDVQLTLETRFKNIEEDDSENKKILYAQTKELVIQVFKSIPIQNEGQQTLMSILKFAKDHARDTSDKTLAKNINRIVENIKKLEEMKMMTSEDKYTSFLRDVALEVVNRQERRAQQRKEIQRLNTTLKNLKKHGKYIEKQIKEFNDYLQSCRENAARRMKTAKKNKPEKFSYKDLAKRGVIVDSDVPRISRGRTKFFISMPSIGVFDIEAKIGGIPVGKMRLDLEDLLERKEANQPTLETEQVTLNVQATVILVNKYFLS